MRELKGTVRTSINPRALEVLLQLPEGVEIKQFYYDFNTDTVMLRLESVDFPFYLPREGAPISDPWVMASITTVEHDGKKVNILEWDFPKQI